MQANDPKTLIAPLRAAMVDFTESGVRRALGDLLAADAVVHMCHPFGDLTGSDALYDQIYAGLFHALPDLERRDWLVMAGDTDAGDHWIGCGGFYCGVFSRPWLHIRPTGHVVHLRFHEYYRVVDGKVVEVQAIWDIPELMMQARAWPMVPSLGRDWCVPGPATQDGLSRPPRNAVQSATSAAHILAMLKDLQRHPKEGGVELMNLPKYWHPKINWYGPAGIGTARGIDGFRHWHQIPFLAAMPDRGQYADEIRPHFFADNMFVAVTGWPDMVQTHSHAGWLGLPPTGKKISLRSLDFWRLEGGLIRENWVLVDLLDVYHQLGVDVLARMREFNKADETMKASAP